jgi:hypothetical protein
MPFYELEELLDDLKELNEKEEEERKKSEDSQKGKMPSMNTNSMMKQAKVNTQMPKMPNFKL